MPARYHWLSDNVKSFVEEPHSAICSQRREQSALDLTARESAENRKATLDLVRDGPSHLVGLQDSAASSISMPQSPILSPNSPCLGAMSF